MSELIGEKYIGYSDGALQLMNLEQKLVTFCNENLVVDETLLNDKGLGYNQALCEVLDLIGNIISNKETK